MDYSPKGGREADRTEQLNTGTHNKYTVEDFSIIIEKEVGVFLEFPSFFYDPTNVGNLISGSSASSKSSLYIWKFSVHVLLKPTLQDLEHNLAMNAIIE